MHSFDVEEIHISFIEYTECPLWCIRFPWLYTMNIILLYLIVQMQRMNSHNTLSSMADLCNLKIISYLGINALVCISWDC